MQEVGEKKTTQKAFLCSTLMKSYAFVIMLLPWLSFSRARSAEVTRFIVEEFMGKDALKVNFSTSCINARNKAK